MAARKPSPRREKTAEGQTDEGGPRNHKNSQQAVNVSGAPLTKYPALRSQNALQFLRRLLNMPKELVGDTGQQLGLHPGGGAAVLDSHEDAVQEHRPAVPLSPEGEQDGQGSATPPGG